LCFGKTRQVRLISSLVTCFYHDSKQRGYGPKNDSTGKAVFGTLGVGNSQLVFTVLSVPWFRLQVEMSTEQDLSSELARKMEAQEGTDHVHGWRFEN